ncbi:MAG: response regulator [Elusimicrobia bacterium]|nr:response regulator [Elusimicrobiota bacterium]
MGRPADGPSRLLVADDAAVAVVIRRLLAARGWPAAAPGSAEEVLRAIDEGGFDLLLLDMHLAGVEVADALARAARANPRAPVLLMSAGHESESAGLIRALGAHGPLRKPFAPDELYAWLERLARESGAGERRRRLLVVEDDPGQLVDLRRRLEALGYETAAAESAEEALRVLAGGGFDAVLTDNVLPGITALQALRRLASHGAPVLVMSRDHCAEMAEDARLLGAAACVPKPVDLALVDGLLRRALSGSKG